MKKILMSMVCLLAAGVVSVKAQDAKAKITLQHNGVPTFYNSDAMETAMSAAVDGDTIYISEGTISNGFTISKKLTFIGAGGERTVVNGHIYVSIGDGTDSLTTRLLDGIQMNYLQVIKAVKGLHIRKCSFTEFSCSSAKAENVIIDRCRQKSGYGFYTTNVSGMKVYNSYIYLLSIASGINNPSDVTFENCNIFSVNGLVYPLSFYNCIINSSSLGNASNTYAYCLCSSNTYTGGENFNCWQASSPLDLTTEQLESNGYIGSDGTIVGMYGGTTPYTLETSAPRVSDYSAAVNPQTMEVTVTLKVTNE